MIMDPGPGTRDPELFVSYLADFNEHYWRRPADRRRTCEALAGALVTLALILVTALILWTD